ncbi:hypothetical protein MKW98_005368, partial [Papaver atlanticum]
LKLKRCLKNCLDVECQGCFNITTVFSHSQTVVVCGNCQSCANQLEVKLDLLREAHSGEKGD